MVSIFSRIRLEKEMPEAERYRLKPLSPGKSFPEKFDIYRDGEYNDHLQGFGKAFTDLTEAFKNIAQPDFNVVFSNIMLLLQRYAWCIPSNTQEATPDISLFDHLKTTCAIATCLYYYHSLNLKEAEVKNATTDKFLLLVGDLSGIQNYIFSITHIGVGGAAKRLRARSFQLNITSEIISHKILHAFDLSPANILMVSGGKFYILLPKTEDAENKILSIKKEVDSWLYEKLNAEVNVNIATMPLAGKDFERYGDIMKKINGAQSIGQLFKGLYYHKATLRHVWPLTTPDSLPYRVCIEEFVKKYLPQSNVCGKEGDHDICRIAGGGDLELIEQAKTILSNIYSEVHLNDLGLSRSDIIVDITGGTKSITIGLIFGALDSAIDIQYVEQQSKKYDVISLTITPEMILDKAGEYLIQLYSKMQEKRGLT